MQEENFILLLGKQLSGDLSAAEAAALEEWLKTSPEHRQLAGQIRQVWQQVGTAEKTFRPDLDADFRKVQARIRALDKSAEQRGRTVSLWSAGQTWLRLAAALTLILGAVWGYDHFVRPAAMVTQIVDNDAKREYVLPDGSHVWVRQGGQLSYPAAFKGSERRVQLRGEAYFQVSHDAGHPFRVEMENGGSVEVLGTEFGVRQSADDGAASVLVRSGKVRFAPAAQAEPAVLTASQRGVYNRAQSGSIQVSKVTTFNDLAWQTGGLEFVNTPLADVVADLENYYGVKIELQNSALRACPYTAPLTSKPLDNVLKNLALIYQLKVEARQAGEYVLRGGVCQ